MPLQSILESHLDLNARPWHLLCDIYLYDIDSLRVFISKYVK